MSVYIGRYIVYTYICSPAPREYNRLTQTIFNLFSWLFLVLLLSTYATFGWAAILFYIDCFSFPPRKKRKLSFEMINFCCVHTSQPVLNNRRGATSFTCVMENLTQKEAFAITAACDRFALHCAGPSSAVTIWWLIESVCFVIFDWVSWLSRSWVKNIYSCVYRLLSCWRTPILYVFLHFIYCCTLDAYFHRKYNATRVGWLSSALNRRCCRFYPRTVSYIWISDEVIVQTDSSQISICFFTFFGVKTVDWLDSFIIHSIDCFNCYSSGPLVTFLK